MFGNHDIPGQRRHLKIYAADPMTGRRASQRITIDIENEPDLRKGPEGDIVQVVDYDGKYQCYYEPVDLNRPALLMDAGLEPDEANPQFHQQMVYAVTMKVIESARRALGRPITFYRPSARQPRLRLFPHAFIGANAFFDSKLNAILFGYFRASQSQPGPNLPGQCIFTCLSHDIIAHEVTHAIVHRLRQYFLEPTNADVLAFHEAFADLVALFQRFSYRSLIIEELHESGGRVELSNWLVSLAQQFGLATGTGKALRSAIGQVDPRAIETEFEPHDRGAILVSAIFGGFLRVVNHRTNELFRIASGGSGIKPPGRLPTDLVERLATEVADVADRVLRMCFRAFDYLPPVDVTFGDYLRALVTADFELSPDDRDELRFSMIEEFRLRGIYPEGVVSLAEKSLVLPSADYLPKLPGKFEQHTFHLLALTASALDWSARLRIRQKQRLKARTSRRSALPGFEDALREYEKFVVEPEQPEREQSEIARGLNKYAKQNAGDLGLDPKYKILVAGFHPVFRIGRDQRLVVELVAQFVQTKDAPIKGSRGTRPLRGGVTVVFGADNVPRYAVGKSFLAQELGDRQDAQDEWLETLGLNDPRMPWSSAQYRNEFFARMTDLRRLHGG
jgi:hypothetical protein